MPIKSLLKQIISISSFVLWNHMASTLKRHPDDARIDHLEARMLVIREPWGTKLQSNLTKDMIP